MKKKLNFKATNIPDLIDKGKEVQFVKGNGEIITINEKNRKLPASTQGTIDLFKELGKIFESAYNFNTQNNDKRNSL